MLFFFKGCLIKISIWLKKFLLMAPWILIKYFLCSVALSTFTLVTFLLEHNFGQCGFCFGIFLLKSASFSFLKNNLTSKHFYSYWKPSSTAVCFSLVTSPIPLDLGDLSRIYSFPMFSYSISCSVWCKTDFKVHTRTEVNMKDSRILAFGFASGLYYYNK